MPFFPLQLPERIFDENRTITSNTQNQRSEDTYLVPAAKSVQPTAFSSVTIPQSPFLGQNTYGSPHCDSYCSESADTAGPDGTKLRVIRQRNPYGYMPCMTCNENNQMIGVSLDWRNLTFNLVVYSADCQLISATQVERKTTTNFGGGYFFMDNRNYTIVGTRYTLVCFDTRQITADCGTGDANSLTPLWTSDNLVRSVFGPLWEENALYSAMPVWGVENTYYCLFAGKYSLSEQEYHRPAAMAVVRIVEDSRADNGCETTVMDSIIFEDEWNNNTFSVDETGAYFVTNVVEPIKKTPASYGYLRKVAYDASSGTLTPVYASRYNSAQYLKLGQKNIGSGTTPTLFDTSKGEKLVAITDNDNPRMNVVVYDRMTGDKRSETPVFAKMRSADEASLIGVQDTLIVESNYGHEFTYPASQLTAIEPGMSRLDLPEGELPESVNETWSDERTSFLAMSMLARQTGVVFAHTADWSGPESATEGAVYFISAIDAYTGRTIWRVPLGRGVEFCHDYGGVYFNRKGSLFVGTANYIISVQNDEEVEEAGDENGVE